MAQPAHSAARKDGGRPALDALVSEGEALSDKVRGAVDDHTHVAGELKDLADELDDVLFRLAGLTTRRPRP